MRTNEEMGFAMTIAGVISTPGTVKNRGKRQGIEEQIYTLIANKKSREIHRKKANKTPENKAKNSTCEDQKATP